MKGGNEMCHTGEFSCRHHGHHGLSRVGHHDSCCHGPSHLMRGFPTREEIIAELEEYLKQLQAEVKGVEERIAELQKKG